MSEPCQSAVGGVHFRGKEHVWQPVGLQPEGWAGLLESTSQDWQEPLCSPWKELWTLL